MRLTVDRVRAGCEWQRELCRKNGAPTYVALISGLIDRLGVDDDVTELLTADGQDPVQSALCLRLFGAVNRVAVATSEDWIRTYYPTLGGHTDPDRVGPAFFDFLRANLAAVRKEMGTAVQTNEVGRSAPLSAAMNHVALATGKPLRLLEVGASAGLHLLLDRYVVAGGGRSWGPPDAALRLTGHFVEGSPPAATPRISQRRRCDLSPVDVHDPAGRRLLRSFVWPEHVERARRLNAALAVARSAPRLRIDTADACTWVEAHTGDRTPGQTTVVFHSIVLPYLDQTARDRFEALVRSRGEAADDTGPMARVSLEPSEADTNVVHLTCDLWPPGRRLLLATTTPHGTQVRWHPREVAWP
jgi:hypothetical protein